MKLTKDDRCNQIFYFAQRIEAFKSRIENAGTWTTDEMMEYYKEELKNAQMWFEYHTEQLRILQTDSVSQNILEKSALTL